MKFKVSKIFRRLVEGSDQPKLVVVCLNGGLGNQLFQYSAGIYLAKLTGGTVLLDITPLNKVKEGQTRRVFALKGLGLGDLEVINKAQGYVIKLLSKILPALVQRVQETQEFKFGIPSQLFGRVFVLVGYWQVRCYVDSSFSVVHEGIKDRLKRIRQSTIAQCIQADIALICIHVRATDYNDDWLICRQEYFDRAIGRVLGVRRIADPSIIIFTDSPEWCQRNLRFQFATYFIKDLCDFVDSDHLLLMSLAKNLVISNSTFSWWSGYLATRLTTDSFVVAPSSWNRTIDPLRFDFYPPEWSVVRV